jgi:CHAT domain-containing protein
LTAVVEWAYTDQGQVTISAPNDAARSVRSPRRAENFQIMVKGEQIHLPPRSSVHLVCSTDKWIGLSGPLDWTLDGAACDRGGALPTGAYRSVDLSTGHLRTVAGTLELERATRQGEDQVMAPVLLSPRHTALLDPRPHLMWAEKVNAAEYRIELVGPTTSSLTVPVNYGGSCLPVDGVWEGAENICQADYPKDWPPLAVGRSHIRLGARLEPSLFGPSTLQMQPQGEEIRLLSPEEKAVAKRDLDALRAADDTMVTGGLLHAGYLASHGLYVDAIARYGEILSLNTSPSISRSSNWADPKLGAVIRVTLGDIFVAIHLPNLALQQYQHAEEGSAGAPIRAAAELGIGRVEFFHGSFVAAQDRFLEAGKLYAGLGLVAEEAAAQRAAAEAAAHIQSPTDAASLLRRGEDSLREGRVATADASFRAALVVALRGGDQRAEAAARRGIVSCFPVEWAENLGQLQITRELHHQLGDLESEATDLNDSAEILHSYGLARSAQELLTEALTLEHRSTAGEQPRTLEALGMAEQDIGLYEEARGHLAQARDRWHARSPASFEASRAEIELGALDLRLGLYDSAEQSLRAAKPGMEQLQTQFTEKAASAARMAGDPSKMGKKMAAMLSSLTNPSTDPGPVLIEPRLLAAVREVNAKWNWYAAVLGNGEAPESRPEDDSRLMETLSAGRKLRDRSLRISEQAGAPGGFFASYARLGQFPGNCNLHILNLLADVYQFSGRTEDAAASNRQAWKTHDEAELATHQAVLGALHIPDSPEDREAQALGLKLPPSASNSCLGRSGAVSIPANDLWRGDLAAAQGRLDDAAKFYQQPAANPALRPEALTRLAAVFEREGDRQRAVDTLRQAVDAVEALQEHLQLEQLVASWNSRQAPLYAQVVDQLHGLGRDDEAFDYAERSRARAFLNQLGNHRLAADKAPPELAAAIYRVRQHLVELESWRKRGRPADVAESMPAGPAMPSRDRGEEEDLTRHEYESLLERLRQANPEYASLVSVQTSKLDQIQRQVLDPQTTLVEYFVMERKTLVWVVNRDDVHCVELPVSAEKLHHDVFYLRNLIAEHDAAARATAGGLYEALFAPVARFVRHSSLVIVPHGPLHYLPFAALWNQGNGRYMIEDFDLTLSPSASALRFVAAKRKPGGGRLLALGNPDGSLGQAEREVQQVASLYESSPHIGGEARESLVHDAAPTVGILHLAAHAYYNDVHPLFTYVALAADTTAATNDERADGKLHVYEIYDLDLRAASLVVLSDCNTALGPRDNGDDVVGLPRAFLYAGASSVVSTLWKLDDPASSAVMEKFYRRLRQGDSTSKALRQAQLDLLADPAWKDPYFWAAFTLTGDWKGSSDLNPDSREESTP